MINSTCRFLLSPLGGRGAVLSKKQIPNEFIIDIYKQPYYLAYKVLSG
jgi:hypothetical protein